MTQTALNKNKVTESDRFMKRVTLMIVVPDLPLPPIPASSGPVKEMLSCSEEDGVFHVKINSSSLDITLTCWRKVLYSLVEGWRSRHSSPALVFGTAIHKALEVFYCAPRSERVIPPDFGKHAELMAYGTEPPDPSLLAYRVLSAFISEADQLQDLPAENKRSIPCGIWTLTHYLRNYIDDPWVVLRDESGPLVERMSEALIINEPDLKVTYFGTVDVILKNVRTEEVLVCDHKTSSVVGKDFYNRLRPNHQYTGYLLLGREALKLKTNSFLVNCVQVKPKPKTSRGTPPDFPRQVTQRSEEDFSEFREVVRQSAKDLRGRLKSGCFTQGPVNACSMYGGCQYLEVCAAPASLRKNILNANFTQEGK